MSAKPSIIVTRREWRNVSLIAAALMLITSLPVLIGFSTQTTDQRFSGFMFGIEDANSYLAKMRQGANGAWAYTVAYTSEVHQPGFLHVHYLLLGKLTGIFASPDNLSFYDALVLAHHGARLFFGFILILVTYKFVAIFIRSRRLRWLTLLVICLGGGLGWLLILTGNSKWLGSLPIDFILPEGYSFYSLYGLPHLSLARICLLCGLMITFHSLTLESARAWVPRMVIAGLIWLAMAIWVPFYVGVVYVILGAWGLAILIAGRKFPIQLFWRCLVGAIPPVVIVIYILILNTSSDVWRMFQAQHVFPSPLPPHFLVGYGLYAFLGLPAFIAIWRHRRSTRSDLLLFLAGWLAISPLLAYFPISVQRRMLEGIFIPLCILAVLGLRMLWRKLRTLHLAPRWSFTALILVALALPSTFLILLTGTLEAFAHPATSRMFYPVGLERAVDQIAARAVPGSIVLINDGNNQLFGSFVPAMANVRVYVGHSVETLYSARKRLETVRFFSGEMPKDEASALIQQNNVAYVVVSPGDQDRADLGLLRLIWEGDGFKVYEVVRS